MRSRLGVSAAALLAMALCISASAQSSPLDLQKLSDLDKDLDTRGLVNGKRAMVCPHSSARALASFVSSNSDSASKTARSFYSGDSGMRWAYVRVGTKAIPTLKADGNTLDPCRDNVRGCLARPSNVRAACDHSGRNGAVLRADLVRHESPPCIRPLASLRNYAASFVDSLHRSPSQYIPRDDGE